MKRLFLALLTIALLSTQASASYYPVYGGSLSEYEWTYNPFSNPVPGTFYGTTVETSPGIWDYVSNGGYMLFVAGMTFNSEGWAPVFEDYIMGDIYAWSRAEHAPTATPIPAPLYLLASGLVSLCVFRRRMQWNK